MIDVIDLSPPKAAPGNGLPTVPAPLWETALSPVPYPAALARMEAHATAVRDGAARELVWLLEHEPVYTSGTSADPRELIGHADIPVFAAGRGGRYTYHGPGQRIAYVILDLKPYGCDLRRHVWRLEELVIQTLADLGVAAERRCGRIGVWVVDRGAEKKIAAIGVKVRRWVAFHGVAINVAPDLGHFAGIVPCGISEFGVTSLADLGIPFSMAEVDAALHRRFAEVFAIDAAVGYRLAGTL